MRVRGLKSRPAPYGYQRTQVALRAGAWIEIEVVNGIDPANGVALRAGAWIEISIRLKKGTKGLGSHSVRVRGLKYNVLVRSPKSRPSHSVRVRGLKYPMPTLDGVAAPVALRAGAWIEIN